MIESRLPVIVDGLRLRGGAFLPEDPLAAVVLLHGIPSTEPDPEDSGYDAFAKHMAEQGFAAAWADMRAARSSPGFFSIEGWVRDARAVVDALRSLSGLASLPLAVVGSSAGGAVATEITRRGAPVDALVLLAAPAAWVSFAGDPGAGLRRITKEAGMAVAPEVAEDPTSWAAEFETVVTEKSIAHVRCPVLIVHGTADDVVPPDHAQRIAARAPRAVVDMVEGAGHRLRLSDDVVRAVVDWLKKTLS